MLNSFSQIFIYICRGNPRKFIFFCVGQELIGGRSYFCFFQFAHKILFYLIQRASFFVLPLSLFLLMLLLLLLLLLLARFILNHPLSFGYKKESKKHFFYIDTTFFLLINQSINHVILRERKKNHFCWQVEEKGSV